ncbi:MAG TPA: hypothetical protein VEI02_09540, partial [Planctomycetota bacterium]|nr:hypothetical protein [Planctomycetota bacterium]
MAPEANPIYKVLRSLWFPVSVNAALLGAAAVVVFRLVSLLAALAFGFDGRPWEADSLFDDVLFHLVTRGLQGVFDLGPYSGFGPIFFVQALTAYFLWATFGLAMYRTLAVRIASDDYVPMDRAFGFAWRAKNTTLLHLPAIALPTLFCWAVIAAVGLVDRIPYLGWTLNVLLLPVVVLFAVVMQLVWFLGVVSMAFTPAAVAAERRGTYDALGKAFTYLMGRPLPAVLYLVTLAALLWVLDSAVFDPERLRAALADLLQPRFAPVSERLDLIVRGEVDALSGFAWFMAWAHRLVLGGLDAVVRGFFLSLAAGGATAL